MGGSCSSFKPPPDRNEKNRSPSITDALRGIPTSQSQARSTPQSPAKAPPRVNMEPELAKRHGAATKIQAVFRRHQMTPTRVSLRVAATQSWRSLPRGRDGKIFPLFSSSLVPLSYVQGVGNMIALRFELEFGLVFLIIYALHYAAIERNLAGDAITEQGIELPFPSAAGSLGNARSLEAVHGLGDAISTIFLTVMTIALRRTYHAWQYQVEDQLVTVADYAVKFSGLPSTASSAQLSAWIRKSFFGVQLVGVTMAMDEKEELKLMRQIASLRSKATDLARSMVRAKTRVGIARREALLSELGALEQKMDDLRKEPKRCVGVAYAVFNRMNDAQQVIDETASHPFSKHAYAEGLTLHAERAPEPSDILWENLHMGAVERASRQSVGLALSLAVTAFSTIIMGIARFIQPVYGDTEHRVLVKVAAPLCIVVGNLAINISVPKIAEYEGWHNATLRNDSLCVKLAIFQVLNSLAGGAMMFVYEGYSLTPEWYTMAGQMTSAIILFTILIADGLGLLRLGACLRRVFVAPCARTQADANRAFKAADPSYLSKRISLVLKYVILAMLMGPFFPLTYLLASIGCVLSYGLDKFNMLRQLPALPKNHAHLVVTTILGRLIPICIALHVPIAILAYSSRAEQLVALHGTSGGGSCAAGAGHAGALDGSDGAQVRGVLSWLAGETSTFVTACNQAVLYMGAGGIVVFVMLLCSLSLRPTDRASTAPSLGSYAQERGTGPEPLHSAQDGLRLYISPIQQQALMDLASKRGEDPLAERSAFTGDSIALSVEAFV